MLDESRSPAIPPPVAAAFGAFPGSARQMLMAARDAILATAEGDARIGKLAETLKWREPAYLTAATRSGSTLRLGRTRPDRAPAMFVNCRTTLVEEVRARCCGVFRYEGTRGIRLLPGVEADAVRHAAWLALTYHLRRREL